MKEFKFFQKEVKGDLTMLPGETRATASLCNWDTPQNHYHLRRLYHTDRNEYQRLRGNSLSEEQILRIRRQSFERMRNTNDDMERYFIENSFRRLTRDLNDNLVEPPVVKPKSKISKFFENYKDEIIMCLLWLPIIIVLYFRLS